MGNIEAQGCTLQSNDDLKELAKMATPTLAKMRADQLSLLSENAPSKGSTKLPSTSGTCQDSDIAQSTFDKSDNRKQVLKAASPALSKFSGPPLNSKKRTHLNASFDASQAN
jgi:hypothetical protein